MRNLDNLTIQTYGTVGSSDFPGAFYGAAKERRSGMLSHTTEYAISMLTQLASGELKKSAEMCSRGNIPQEYGRKILLKLTKAGLVKSYPGAGGGYKLGKSARKITIYDVIKSLNESLIRPSNNKSINQLIQNEVFTVYKKHTIDEIANMQMPEKEYDWTAACSIDEDERDLESALPNGGY